MNNISDEFEFVRKYLTNGGGQLGIHELKIQTPCNKRLLQAFQDQDGPPSIPDLAVLVRHILRRESERAGVRQKLRVPASDKWPDKEEWERYGIRVMVHDTGDFVLDAEPWMPNWLTFADRICPESDAFADKQRRNPQPCSGDPFIHALDHDNVVYEEYLSRGQKEAVRAVLTAPPGATLVVNLPTGLGKSLCGQILSKIPFVDSKSEGVTVVIVPTTALALDQQRNMQKWYFPTAYRGGPDENTQSQNTEIWRKICDGTQGIVFTSPESFMGGLKKALYTAARGGFIKALVIDEAHMVEHWGTDFRPSFQEISGLRLSLLRSCSGPKFRTILLSATLTESSLGLIKTLFGKPGPLGMLSEVQLRPEPAYWVSFCECADDKVIRVLDAINHLPRPLILYSSTIRQWRNGTSWGAIEWYERLRQEGYRRIDIMTGETSTTEREGIIKNWSQGNIDIIVATSSFGLGIDYRSVRSVIHACVPETSDRFYQEVGRTGRDGKASISLVVYEEKDIKTATGMNGQLVIGLDKGLERWLRMFNKKQNLSGSCIKVPIDVTRQYRHNPKSKLNIEWNIKTLTLMNRAGLITLDDEPSSLSDSDSTANQEGLTNDATEEAHLRRVIEIINNRHNSREIWERLVEPNREHTAMAYKSQLNLMKDLLEQKKCVSEILGKLYSAKDISSRGAENRIYVAPSCGGCGFCRLNGKEPYTSPAHSRHIDWPPYTSVGARLEKYLAGGSVFALFYRASDDLKAQMSALVRSLGWLLQEGIRSLVCPDNLLREFVKEVSDMKKLPVMVQNSYVPREMPKVPTTVFYLVGEPVAQLDAWLSKCRRVGIDSEPYVIVLPNNAVDPQRPDRLLKGCLPCNYCTQDELDAQEVLL